MPLLIGLGAIAVASCQHADAPATGPAKPIVISTIFAYFDAARSIGGDKVDAEILLPPNQSPHEYEPSFEDKMKLGRASLLIYNGLGLDERFASIADSSSTIKKLEIASEVPTTVLSADEVALGKTRAESNINNPHIWLDPVVQMKATEKIRDALMEIDPADKATFTANADKYLADLHGLDDAYKAAVPTFKTKQFIGFHSAYEYLAHRYGLEQIASIEELPGEGITPEQAQKIIDLIKKNHIQYVAKETAFNEKGADAIVRETGVKLITLQPLETYDNATDTYVSLMKQNLEAFKTALGAR